MTVTEKNLNHLESRINKALGHGHKAMYSRNKEGELVPNVGFVHLTSQTYFGFRFEQMCEGGGADDICTLGTKVETYEKGLCFLNGINAGKRLEKTLTFKSDNATDLEAFNRVALDTAFDTNNDITVLYKSDDTIGLIVKGNNS